MPIEKTRMWTFYLAGFVWLLSGFVLLGWWLDIDFLKRPFPNLNAMNPVVALGCSLSSLAFFLTFTPRLTHTSHVAASAISIIVGLLGFAKILSLLAVELPFNQLVIQDRLADGGVNAVIITMSANGAVNLMLVGFILWLARRRPILSQAISIFVFVLAWFPMLGYLYNVPEFYGQLPFFPMAIHSAFCFLLLSLALFFVQCDEGWAKEFISTYEGGRLFRVLIPLAIVVPTGLGFVRLWINRNNSFSAEFGVALLISSIILVFVWAVGYNAKLLNERDSERRKLLIDLASNAGKLKESNEEVATINEELTAANEELTSANEELFAVNEKLTEATKLIQEQSETIIRQKDEHLNRVLDSSDHIIWSFDMTGKDQDYISRSVQKIWGLSPEQFHANKSVREEMVYPPDKELWKAARKRLTDFDRASETVRFLDSAGNIHWMRMEAWITKDKNGTPLRQEGVASDISTLKEKESELLSERKLMRSLIDNIPDYIFVKDEQSRHVINNRANIEFLGASDEQETLGKTLTDYYGEGATPYLEDDRYVLSTGLPIVNKEEIIYSHGDARTLLTTKVALRDEDGNITGLAGISRDITQLRKQDHLLNQYRKNMDIIFSNTKEEILLLDHEGKVLLFNDAFASFIKLITGWLPVIGNFIWDITMPDRSEAARELFNRAKSGESIFTEAKVVVEGETIVHEVQCEPIYVNNSIQYVSIISVDVTQRKRAERELQESRFLLDEANKVANIGYWSYDPQTNHSFWSKQTNLILGWSSEAPTIEDFFKIVHPDDRTRVEAESMKTLQGGLLYSIEHRIVRPLTGEVRWIDVRADFIVNDDSSQLLVGVMKDITVRKLSERELQRSRYLLSKANEVAEIGSWSIDPDTKHVTMDDQARLIFGRPPNYQGTLDGYIGNVHPDDRTRVNEAVMQSLSQSKGYNVEHRIVRPSDGAVRWVHEKADFILDENNSRLIVGVIQDITTRKETEQELSRSRHLLVKANEVAQIGSWSYDPEKNLAEWNKSAREILGIPLNHPSTFEAYFNLVFREDRELVFTFTQAAFKEKEMYNLEHRITRLSDGKVRWVHMRADFIRDENDSRILMGVIQDITDRKTIEDVLTEYNTRYEIVSKATNDAIWDWDILNDTMKWNHGIQTIFGYDIQVLKSADLWWREKIHPVDKDRIDLELAEIFARKESNWVSQYQYLCKDGRYKHVLDRAYVVYEHEKPVRVIGAMQDVTSQKEYEIAVTAIARELSDLIENANTPIFGTDRNGYINEWNKVTSKLTGFSRNEALGKKLPEFMNEPEHSGFQLMQEMAASGNPISNLEMPMMTKDKRELIILLNATPRRDSKQEISGMLMVGQDITELIEYRHNLEVKVQERTEELNQALEKEKELVEMKSKFVSIASHEFRTPLSSISLATGFIRKYQNKMKPADVDAKLANIEKQVDQMTYLLDDVLLVSKADSGKMQIKLCEIRVETFEALAKEVIQNTGARHKLLVSMECTKRTVMSDEKLIRNIIMNLITNAVKFSPEAKQIFMTIKCDHKNLFVTVKDAGIGIPTADLKNLFTSFSRGGNVGTIEGTGLGLSIVKKACDLLNGKVEVQSEVGKGTEFRITLPLK